MMKHKESRLVTLPKGGVTYHCKFTVAEAFYRHGTGKQTAPEAYAVAQALREQAEARVLLEQGAAR